MLGPHVLKGKGKFIDPDHRAGERRLQEMQSAVGLFNLVLFPKVFEF